MEIGNMIWGHSRGTYEVPRGQWQNRFGQFLDRIGCDGYGHVDQNNPYINDRGGITTEMFTINPYWWGDDDNIEECEKPNFIYNPTGFTLSWYKYPLRDSYSNQELTYKEFDDMLKDCERYMKMLNQIHCCDDCDEDYEDYSDEDFEI